MNMPITRTANGYRLGNLECTGLPPRQSQTLLLRARGQSGTEAAAVMGCGAQSIKNNTATLFYKLGASNIAALITIAFERGHLSIVKTLAVIVVALYTSMVPFTHQTDIDTPRPPSRVARARRKEATA